MQKKIELFGLLTWTAFFIAFLYLCLKQDAKERQKLNDQILINDFSRMSESKKIKDAYKRTTGDYLDEPLEE